ncbi:MAG: hypothetical protein K0R14_2141 [Burkholderiales bacterium]|nr:hypothetical protein [Burkholderiales bacterium]
MPPGCHPLVSVARYTLPKAVAIYTVSIVPLFATEIEFIALPSGTRSPPRGLPHAPPGKEDLYTLPFEVAT